MRRKHKKQNLYYISVRLLIQFQFHVITPNRIIILIALPFLGFIFILTYLRFFFLPFRLITFFFLLYVWFLGTLHSSTYLLFDDMLLFSSATDSWSHNFFFVYFSPFVSPFQPFNLLPSSFLLFYLFRFSILIFFVLQSFFSYTFITYTKSKKEKIFFVSFRSYKKKEINKKNTKNIL